MAYPGAKVNSATLFMSRKEAKAWQKYRNRFDYNLIWGMHPKAVARIEARKKQDPTYDAKYAYILVGHTQKLAYVTPDKTKAFKTDGYYKTHIPWRSFRFIRWCRSMDL